MTTTFVVDALCVQPVLVAFGALALSRPGLGADAVTVAEWYRRKAAVLRQLAVEEPASQDRYRTWAASADRHAEQLLAGGA